MAAKLPPLVEVEGLVVEVGALVLDSAAPWTGDRAGRTGDDIVGTPPRTIGRGAFRRLVSALFALLPPPPSSPAARVPATGDRKIPCCK